MLEIRGRSWILCVTKLTWGGQAGAAAVWEGCGGFGGYHKTGRVCRNGSSRPNVSTSPSECALCSSSGSELSTSPEKTHLRANSTSFKQQLAQLNKKRRKPNIPKTDQKVKGTNVFSLIGSVTCR